MCQPAVAVAGIGADVGAEPGRWCETVGGLGGRELHFDEAETFVETVEEVELGGERKLRIEI